jgi:DUF4097 and DUF4098 domain-containing protein YvlB
MKGKGMLLVAMLVLGPAAAAADTAAFSKVVPAGPQDRVVISNISGSVTVVAWDRPEVDVQGTLEEGVERVEVDQQAGRVEVKVEQKKPFKQGGDAKLRISVPASASLEVSTVSAPMTVEGILGPARLRSVSGEIRSNVPDAEFEARSVTGRIVLAITGQGARVRATSVSGDVTLAGGGPGSRVSATSVSGDVSLSRGGGEVEVRSTSGSVDIAGDGMAAARMTTVSGSAQFRGSLSREGVVEVESVSGDVQVVAQAPAGFRYDLNAYSGRVRTCFGASVVEGQLTGVQGEGAGNVFAKSRSGSIELCDR